MQKNPGQRLPSLRITMGSSNVLKNSINETDPLLESFGSRR